MAAVLTFASLAGLAVAQYKPTWNYTNLPPQTEQGQTGWNNCLPQNAGPNSNCQTAVLSVSAVQVISDLLYSNSVSDFCVFSAPQPNSLIGAVEESTVAFCLPGNTHGARTLPPGSFSQLHWVQTPNYIQVRAKGDFTQINARRGDGGGELDPHGATGNGNPIGSLVFTSAFGGGMRQVKEWMSFVAYNELCFRACNPDDPNAWLWCQHVYDEQGCDWVMPGQAGPGFTNCLGDSEVAPPGIAPGWTSTWSQGMPHQPSAHPAPAVSQCQTLANVGAYAQQLTTVAVATPSSSALPSSSTSTMTVLSTSTITPVTPAAAVFNAATTLPVISSAPSVLPSAVASITGAASTSAAASIALALGSLAALFALL